MQKTSVMLSLFLLLSARAAYADSTTAMADGDPSGDGSLLTTNTVALGPTTPVALWRTSDQNLQTTTILAETNSSEMGIFAVTEVGDAGTADLHPALIYGVPAMMLLVLLILLAIFILRRRKQKQSKPDELGSENCKSPIFEEDTPSVMEIEMEELDKWMNSLKRNAECEYLPAVKEEKDCNANPSVALELSRPRTDHKEEMTSQSS